MPKGVGYNSSPSKLKLREMIKGFDTSKAKAVEMPKPDTSKMKKSKGKK